MSPRENALRVSATNVLSLLLPDSGRFQRSNPKHPPSWDQIPEVGASLGASARTGFSQGSDPVCPAGRGEGQAPHPLPRGLPREGQGSSQAPGLQRLVAGQVQVPSEANPAGEPPAKGPPPRHPPREVLRAAHGDLRHQVHLPLS